MTIGTAPAGTLPCGTTMSLLGSGSGILHVLVVNENRIRVTFATAMRADRYGTSGDVFNPENYTIFSVATSQDRDGVVARDVKVAGVEQIDDVTFDVLLDRPMSSNPARYMLAISGIQTSDLTDRIPPSIFEFSSVRFARSPLESSLVLDNRDFAFAKSFEYDTNDVAIQAGLEAYKRRVFRCITSRKDSFVHLQGYGTSAHLAVKKLARGGIKELLAIEAEEQIRKQPETVACTVKGVDENGILYLVISALARIGSSIVPVNERVKIQ